MTGGEAAVPGPVLPAPARRATPGAPALGTDLLVETLAGAAAAEAVDDVVAAVLGPGLDVEDAADRVLGACVAQGPPQDDATLLVVRV